MSVLYRHLAQDACPDSNRPTRQLRQRMENTFSANDPEHVKTTQGIQ